ncbi:unnamed protein product [Schistosoma margrebowiei]|uniref:Uncharacterized protein n=1 Tax=Schistosoma margrebowiei TaxID=48269 RepID=A0A183N7E0_9TREM|nr:unnamed protein product [Schistosoma margrebowiei]
MKISTYQGENRKPRTAYMQPDDLNSADHLAVLQHTHQQMKVKTPSVAAATSASVGLNIHEGKRKIMKYNTGR